MIKTAIILAILAVIIGFYIKENQYYPFLIGEEYQSMTATQKMEKITTLIKKTAGSRSQWPFNLRLFQIMFQDNNKSFQPDQDDMPHGMLGFTRREKILHEVGLTAEFTFKSNNKHNYTGIFKGCQNGILRTSTVFTPQGGVVVPNFAYKFLRSGVRSANLLTMYGITGQKDYNVLLHDQTTHFPNMNDDVEFNYKLLSHAFKKVSDYPNMLGLHDAATYDENGNKELHPEFPYRVIFHPTKEARNANKNEGNITAYMHIEQLLGKQFSTLFEVYAQPTPFSDNVIHIGSLHMNTPFTTSEFGDHHLYFAHIKFEEDLAIKPEWEDAAEEINEKQSKIKPQYYYPDIQD